MREYFPIAEVLGFDFVHRCQALLIDFCFGMEEMKKWKQQQVMSLLFRVTGTPSQITKKTKPWNMAVKWPIL